jgi:hypothetical protein
MRRREDFPHGWESVLQRRRAKTSCYGFWWEVAQKGNLQELQMKARNARKGYEMMEQQVVDLYMELNLRNAGHSGRAV